MVFSKTGRFLSKAEILGVGVFSPLSTKFALDTSILAALSKALSRRRLDRESTVYTAPCAEKCHLEMSSWF